MRGKRWLRYIAVLLNLRKREYQMVEIERKYPTEVPEEGRDGATGGDLDQVLR